MLTAIKLLALSRQQAKQPQSLERRPERFPTMDEAESVSQYNALRSKLIISYAGCLRTIYQAQRYSGGTALDLCCGSGDYTLLMAKHLGFDHVHGVDLSEEMIAEARAKAKRWGLSDRVTFEVGNALIADEHGQKYDVVTCNDALHHMNGALPEYTSDFSRLSLEERAVAMRSATAQVNALLTAMNTACKPEGVALAMDLVRLRTRALTRQFTRIVGSDYWRSGWRRFYRDFSRSMRAAWTEDELVAATPATNDTEVWAHIRQEPLPTTQTVLRVPNDGAGLRLRSGSPWSVSESPVPLKWRWDWQIYKSTLQRGTIICAEKSEGLLEEKALASVSK